MHNAKSTAGAPSASSGHFEKETGWEYRDSYYQGTERPPGNRSSPYNCPCSAPPGQFIDVSWIVDPPWSTAEFINGFLLLRFHRDVHPKTLV